MCHIEGVRDYFGVALLQRPSGVPRHASPTLDDGEALVLWTKTQPASWWARKAVTSCSTQPVAYT